MSVSLKPVGLRYGYLTNRVSTSCYWFQAYSELRDRPFALGSRLMKTSLFYHCPKCAADTVLSVKHIDKIGGDGCFNCHSCNEVLHLSDQGMKVLNGRRAELKTLVPYQAGGILMLVAATAIHFLDGMAADTLLLCYIIAVTAILKAHSTFFLDSHLVFHENA